MGKSSAFGVALVVVAGRGEAATADRTAALALATAGEAAPGTTFADAVVETVGRTAAGAVTADAFPPEPTVVQAPPAAGAVAVG